MAWGLDVKLNCSGYIMLSGLRHPNSRTTWNSRASLPALTPPQSCSYWFAFPALQPPVPFSLAAPPASLQAALGESAAAAAAEACSNHVAAAGGTPAWLVVVGSDGQVATAPLTEWHSLQQQADRGGGSDQVYVAVADSSNQAAHPGWPLRNLLLLAAARWGQGMQSGTLCSAGDFAVKGLAWPLCSTGLSPCTLLQQPLHPAYP